MLTCVSPIARSMSMSITWPFVVVLAAGCAASTSTPESATSDEALTCDLGAPGALSEACNKGSAAVPIAAAPLASATPPQIQADTTAYGVHLVTGVMDEGALRFVPAQTTTYDIYLGTPNIPFRVVSGDSVVTPSCSSSITATECASLRKVISYELTAGQTYRLEIGPTSPAIRYVRLYIQTRVVVAACSAGDLSEETTACTAAIDDGDQPINAGSLVMGPTPVLAVDTVYGVHLPSTGTNIYGGDFAFVPPSDGDYELYLGTPNIPLRITANGLTMNLTCTRLISADECSLLRRGDRLPLQGGVTYTFALGPNPNTRYVRVAIRKSVTSDVKLSAAQLFAAGTTPGYIKAADLDGDHVLDLVVSTPDDAGGMTTVDLLQGSGTGSFTLVRQITTSAPGETVVSDFNHDGIADIVGIAFDGQGPLPDFYLQGQAAAPFTYAQSTWGSARDFQPYMSGADFDEDGTVDVVAAYADSTSTTGPAGFVIIAVPSFAVMQDVPAFGHATSQAIAGDFNGDGHQDVMVASSAASAVKLYTGDGSGTVTFALDVTLPGSAIRQIAAFDLDRDGRSDLVAIHADQTVTVSYGLATGFSAPQVLATGFSLARGIAAGDFDHDGRLDLAIGSFGSEGKIAVFLATDAGFVLGGTLTVPGGNSSSDLVVGDFNGDGFDDLAATALGAVAVFLSTP